MKQDTLLKALKISLSIVGIIWLVFIIDILVPGDFSFAGIIPRDIDGLKGIILSPFIHAGIMHILGNTLPLMILTFLIFAFYPRLAWYVMILSIIFSGVAVWLLARPAPHVGASSLLYALAAFLITAGFYARSFQALIVSVFVIFVYGGLIWGIFPSQPWISWEGHLFGALSGVLLAFLLKNNIQKASAD